MPNNWRKRPLSNIYNKNKYKIMNKDKSLYNTPFMQFKGNEKLLFFVNDEEWCLDDITKWMDVINSVYPALSLVVLPVSMLKGVEKITRKEYTMLNNILKRMKDKNNV